MKKYLLILLLFAISAPIFAQNIPFEKKYFDNINDYNKAMDALLDGDDYFEENDYRTALPFYLEAQELNSNNAELNFKIGICHLNLSDKSLALPFFQKSYRLDSISKTNISFYLGEAYHYALKFEKAIQFYQKYLQSNNPSIKRATLEKKILECQNGIKLREHHTIGLISDIKSINSEYADYSPMLTADMQTMFFTSRRSNTTGGEKDEFDMQYYEDIYFVERIGQNQWSSPKKLKGSINTKRHDANVGITNDGQHLFIYRSESGNGDLFESDFNNNEWGKPYKLPEPVNSKYIEKCISFSPDHRIAYFVSNRPGTIGGLDIFTVEIDENGNYGEVKNLGDSINTIYNEDGVFIHPDGKTMYFSSKGHNTMGGYDIFKATKDSNGIWHKPVNMGVPINSADDDVFLVVASDGKTGYFSSIRPNGLGEKDIYRISFSESDKDSINTQLIVVTGIIKDTILQIPLEAKIEIADNETQKIITNLKSNSDGTFSITLPLGKNYAIHTEKEGYLFYSKNFDLTDSVSFEKINLDIQMSKIKANAKTALRNIFFAYGKSILRPESIMELNKVYDFLIAYPEIKLEIAGHTDNISSRAFNIRLSNRRAQAVVQFLTKKGIAKERLISKGYAFDQAIGDNNTREGRQLNRRVEFKIIKIN